MATKKNILIFSDWYLPAYKAGGPVKSIAALVYYLKDDFNFYIITGNKDLFSAQIHPNINSNTWNVLPNGEQVFYFSDDDFSFTKLSALLKEIPYDAIYLNSFFSKRFTIYPLLLKKLGKINTPVLLAPRGMLGNGALSLKSKKKNIFIALAKTIGLYKNIIWHATSTQEENEIKQLISNTDTSYVISNLTLPPTTNRITYDKEINQLKICCVARISKVKNLLFALKVLQKINIGSVIFDLYGPIEEVDYHQQCVSLIAQLPKNISVTFKGDLQSNAVEETLKNYHAFFLPTLSENYGHAIVEAMLNGCIPLISNTTPWLNLQAQNIGWDISLNEKEKFVSAIKEMLQINQTDFETKSKAVQQYARINCLDEATVNLYKDLFTTLTQQ